VDGIILIDKVKGFTSFDVVNFLKKRFKLKKVGHTGTLDPLATGLLVVLIGRATKLAQTFLNDAKTYLVEMRLGIKTDTFDITGKIIEENKNPPDPAKIRDMLINFQGEINQRPPIFSALKFKGQRLYKLAREGRGVIAKKRRVFIYYIKKIKIFLPEVFFEVKCSKGTYIRSLCNDIGEVLNCGAVLKELRRIKSGRFIIEDALSIERLKSIKEKKSLEKYLIRI
jgi:tRNA pseudouridine55 synthase